MRQNKKGVFDNLAALVQSLGFLAVLLAVIFLVTAEVKDQVKTVGPCDNNSAWFNDTDDTCRTSSTDARISGGTSSAWNGTGETQEAMSTIPQWLSIIVIAVIGAALLGLVAIFRAR